MNMVEDGLIAIEDPVSKYIPEFANMNVIDEESGAITAAKNQMTVQDLLTHESGLIYGTFDPQSVLGSAIPECRLGAIRHNGTRVSQDSSGTSPALSNQARSGITRGLPMCSAQ